MDSFFCIQQLFCNQTIKRISLQKLQIDLMGVRGLRLSLSLRKIQADQFRPWSCFSFFFGKLDDQTKNCESSSIFQDFLNILFLDAQ